MDSDPIDVKQLDRLKPELFDLARLASKATGMPYAALLVNKKTGTVIAKDYNISALTFDPSDQDTVAVVRKAKRALETSDLSDTYVFSLFEPTLLSFDISLFAKITNFAWCINTADAPDGHYLINEYTPTVYAQQHPNLITIHAAYQQQEALQLVESIKSGPMPKGYRLGG